MNNFKVLDLLTAEIKDHAILLKQLNEYAWEKESALNLINVVYKNENAITNIYVFALLPSGPTIPGHSVYDRESPATKPEYSWEKIVKTSSSWAFDFVDSFRFPEDEPLAKYPPIFSFWAFNEADYRNLGLYK
jgi:hypothetical protein